MLFLMALIKVGEPLLALRRSFMAALIHGVIEFLLNFARLGVRKCLAIALDQMSVWLAEQENNLLRFRLLGLLASICIQLPLFNLLEKSVVLLHLPVAEIAFHRAPNDFFGGQLWNGRRHPRGLAVTGL